MNIAKSVRQYAFVILVLSCVFTAEAQEARRSTRYVRETRVKRDRWGRETTYEVVMPIRRTRTPEPPPPPPVPFREEKNRPDSRDDDNSIEHERWQFAKTVSLPSVVGVNPRRLSDPVGCGAYAIATLVSAIGRDVDDTVFKTIVRDSDLEDDGVAIDEMVSYLSSFFHVTEHKTGRVEQLTEQLDAGLPAVLVVAAPGGPHWVLLSGYRTDEKGKIASWSLVDAGIVKSTMPHEEFIKVWDCSVHYRNYCIFLQPRFSPDSMQSVLDRVFGRLVKKTDYSASGSDVGMIDAIVETTEEQGFNSTELGELLFGAHLRREKPSSDTTRAVAAIEDALDEELDPNEHKLDDQTVKYIGIARRYLYGIPLLLAIEAAIIIAVRRRRGTQWDRSNR